MKQREAVQRAAYCDLCSGRIGRACIIELKEPTAMGMKHFDVCAGCYRTWSVIGRMIAYGMIE